ncbi:MAG: hypothetical protein AB7K41_07445 [Bdellovibrionales bacterium]
MRKLLLFALLLGTVPALAKDVTFVCRDIQGHEMANGVLAVNSRLLGQRPVIGKTEYDRVARQKGLIRYFGGEAKQNFELFDWETAHLISPQYAIAGSFSVDHNEQTGHTAFDLEIVTVDSDAGEDYGGEGVRLRMESVVRPRRAYDTAKKRHVKAMTLETREAVIGEISNYRDGGTENEEKVLCTFKE